MMASIHEDTTVKGIAEQVEKGDVGAFDHDNIQTTRRILWKLDTR